LATPVVARLEEIFDKVEKLYGENKLLELPWGYLALMLFADGGGYDFIVRSSTSILKIFLLIRYLPTMGIVNRGTFRISENSQIFTGSSQH
jgi:hypothetical protein